MFEPEELFVPGSQGTSTLRLSSIEKDFARLASPLESFGTIAEAIKVIADSRQRQLVLLKEYSASKSSSDCFGSGKTPDSRPNSWNARRPAC